MDQDAAASDNRRDTPPPPHPTPRTIDSAELLEGQRELFIRHGAEIYRLRLTRNGKLILHK